MRYLALLFAALVSAGCGLGTYFEGPKFTDYEPVPADKARLYIYRPEWHWMSADLTVGVDGITLAELKGATYVSVLITPRKLPLNYKVTAQFQNVLAGLDPHGHDPLIQRVEARAGQTVFCEFTQELGTPGSPAERRWLYCSEDPAEHEALKHCRRTGPEGDWDPRLRSEP